VPRKVLICRFCLITKKAGRIIGRQNDFPASGFFEYFYGAALDFKLLCPTYRK
jgi:hypothetical protein